MLEAAAAAGASRPGLAIRVSDAEGCMKAWQPRGHPAARLAETWAEPPTLGPHSLAKRRVTLLGRAENQQMSQTGQK